MQVEEADVVCGLENLNHLRLPSFLARRETDVVDGQTTMNKIASV